jgi:hypothetical protein
MYLLYIFPLELHTLIYDFVVLTSLTHTRKILFVVLQIGEAKDLSASLRIVPLRTYTAISGKHVCQSVRVEPSPSL